MGRTARNGSGSSPHARGAHLLQRRARVARGLIPACAGSTKSFRIFRHGFQAHPRMRGEHRVDRPAHHTLGGSSPHARGAHRQRAADGPGHGLIPACAGSTSKPFLSNSRPLAHPRMRGEHLPLLSEWARQHGSSPHARGARPKRGPPCRSSRLIPACAGSTRRRGTGSGRASAHPRMRGEHPVYYAGGLEGDGSSPHARGAQRPAAPTRRRTRLIPACAGST